MSNQETLPKSSEGDSGMEIKNALQDLYDWLSMPDSPAVPDDKYHLMTNAAVALDQFTNRESPRSAPDEGGVYRKTIEAINIALRPYRYQRLPDEVKHDIYAWSADVLQPKVPPETPREITLTAEVESKSGAELLRELEIGPVALRDRKMIDLAARIAELEHQLSLPKVPQSEEMRELTRRVLELEAENARLKNGLGKSSEVATFFMDGPVFMKRVELEGWRTVYAELERKYFELEKAADNRIADLADLRSKEAERDRYRLALERIANEPLHNSSLWSNGIAREATKEAVK